jgi:hypothetical protein
VAATGVAGSSATGVESATGAASTGASGSSTGTAATGGNSAPAAPVYDALTNIIVVDQPNTEQRFAETQASSWNMETYLESFRL